MAQRLSWGILGTGNIAKQFAAGVAAALRSRVAAVGSRTREAAQAFADRFGVQRIHGSYDELLADPAVEAVYVSLPNNLHHQWTIQALRAGKHVLCEKPLASNLAQAKEMFDTARREGRLLMEAFMYRTHPQTLAVQDAVRRGAIGEVRLIRTSFCFKVAKWQGNIRFDPRLDGGVLMDVGCYCVSFARLFAGGDPASVHVVHHRHESGVDDIAAGTLAFPNGVLASFTCGMSLHADNTAYICGSEGYIEVPVPWKPPVKGASFTVARSTPPRMDQPASAAPTPPPRQTITLDAGGELYGLEADAFATAVFDGAPPPVSEADSLGNQAVLDELRRQVGTMSGPSHQQAQVAP